jgi:hypothetical protein
MWYWLIGAAGVIALLGLFILERDGRDGGPGRTDCEVTGQVLDAAGAPVGGAELSVSESSGTGGARRFIEENEEGRFAFSIAPGRYRLSCVRDGYEPYEEVLDIRPPGARLIIRLRPAAGE